MKLREEMPELDGAVNWLNRKVTKNELVGEKPTLFHFWSVSCHLCKKALLDINKLRDDYREELNVVAVHMPRIKSDHDINVIKQTSCDHDITQPIYLDGKFILTDAFGTRTVPAYYIFDRNGQLRHFQAGGNGMKMLQTRLRRILGKG
ncbi:TlpA family protein disulfide reductase [Jeotgalibacillus soli]|uniref:Thiol-disulfide oxidoreductase ykuV n=1 Tax=Jeotgalibacillus soli TaxID=889306 RepID=A0A0C2V6V5_9BACL|nr:redoxin domain-containing protein [Jeotgalibacillus soli]KIL44697.1 thiol-disulfide oxidoreductase ykuV [Jeotgalibacillus soli]